MEEILQAIRDERARQDAKWGVASERNQTKMTWLTILVEEVGEVANAMLEGDDENYPVELVQVAAVCVAMLESWEAEGGTIAVKHTAAEIAEIAHGIVQGERYNPLDPGKPREGR